MPIQIQNLPKGLVGYKVASFGDWDPYVALTTADDTKDWSGLYVALNRQVAKGYRTDSLNDRGDGTVYLHEVHLLCDVRLAVCDDRQLGDVSIPGETKAAVVRQQLLASGLSLRPGPLIPQLGREGYFFMGYHDEVDIELIVPNNLSALVCLMKATTYTYRSWEKTAKISH